MDNSNAQSWLIERDELGGKITCPVCEKVLSGTLLWHLSFMHHIECRGRDNFRLYVCCCGQFSTESLAQFYKHFRRRGKDCVLKHLLSQST